MKVEQAIYGESRNGHGLREASDPGRLFNDLETRLDLPDTAPTGVQWSPFLRGFPFGEHFVLARTFADPAATRTGLVLTHALVAPLPEVAVLDDLRPLLALLIQTPRAPVVLDSRQVSASNEEPPNARDLVATAEALVTRGTGPVVRTGTEGFEELVVALWFRLWPELRASFAFRLSFGPGDVVDTPRPSLVCSPESLSARWIGYRLVGPSTPTRFSAAAALLSGDAKAEPILNFARELGARLDNLNDLPPLQRAYELWFAPNPSLEDCVSMLRQVERLSPEAATGGSVKDELVRRIETRLATAATEDVYRIRNVRATGLPTAHRLWAGLASWVALNEFVPAQDVEMLNILDDAMSGSSAVEAWREAVLGGIKVAAQSSSSSFPQAFWRWANSRPETLTELAVHLPNATALEARLAETAISEIRQEAGAAIMAISVPKRWWRLHGAAAGACLTPKKALLTQLSLDPSAATQSAIKAALRLATPEQVLSLCLEVADPRLIDVAAELVAGQPHLLQGIDLTRMSAQEVWARSLALNPDAWRGPEDAGKSFASILRALVDTEPVSVELIGALATTPLADIGACPSRPAVWPRISGTTRKLLLHATAKGWLERALANQAIFDLEEPLENALLTEVSLDQQLRSIVAQNPGAVIRVISALPRFDEFRILPFLDIMLTGHSIFTSVDLDSLGHLVLTRRWQRAVDKLVQFARSGRVEVKPALRICVEMVGFLNKWFLGLSPTSQDDPWLVLEVLAVELYPSGPDHDELWSRAGGKDADLRRHGSGRSRWHDALGLIQRGKDPRPFKLLDEMSREFPNNENLRRLTSASHF